MASSEKTRLFVGNIPYEATEDEITKECEIFGPVVSFRFVMDDATGQHRGFGFCTFRDEETVLCAIRNQEGFRCRGRQLKLNHATSKFRSGVSTIWSPPASLITLEQNSPSAVLTAASLSLPYAMATPSSWWPMPCDSKSDMGNFSNLALDSMLSDSEKTVLSDVQYSSWPPQCLMSNLHHNYTDLQPSNENLQCYMLIPQPGLQEAASDKQALTFSDVKPLIATSDSGQLEPVNPSQHLMMNDLGHFSIMGHAYASAHENCAVSAADVSHADTDQISMPNVGQINDVTLEQRFTNAYASEETSDTCMIGNTVNHNTAFIDTKTKYDDTVVTNGKHLQPDESKEHTTMKEEFPSYRHADRLFNGIVPIIPVHEVDATNSINKMCSFHSNLRHLEEPVGFDLVMSVAKIASAREEFHMCTEITTELISKLACLPKRELLAQLSYLQEAFTTAARSVEALYAMFPDVAQLMFMLELIATAIQEGKLLCHAALGVKPQQRQENGKHDSLKKMDGAMCNTLEMKSEPCYKQDLEGNNLVREGLGDVAICTGEHDDEQKGMAIPHTSEFQPFSEQEQQLQSQRLASDEQDQQQCTISAQYTSVQELQLNQCMPHHRSLPRLYSNDRLTYQNDTTSCHNVPHCQNPLSTNSSSMPKHELPSHGSGLSPNECMPHRLSGSLTSGSCMAATNEPVPRQLPSGHDHASQLIQMYGQDPSSMPAQHTDAPSQHQTRPHPQQQSVPPVDNTSKPLEQDIIPAVQPYWGAINMKAQSFHRSSAGKRRAL